MTQAQLYFAPLEGVTDANFRRIHASVADKITSDGAVCARPDKYYTPFFSPTPDTPMADKVERMLTESLALGTQTVPQIMTNRPELFLSAAARLADMGFTEINLNLGCPSGTVVSKKRGAGFLSIPEELDRFFDAVYTAGLPKTAGGTPIRFSVKSRLGVKDISEFSSILSIYSRYPIDELILHPRVRTEMYAGTPHMECFLMALQACSYPICYNGDIFTLSDYLGLKEALAHTDRPISLMVGRGAVSNPALFSVLRGGAPLKKEHLYIFYRDLMEDARTRLSGERHVLFRAKELWAYWIPMFDDVKGYLKRLRKANTLSEFTSIAEAIFFDCPLRADAGFRGRAELDL